MLSISRITYHWIMAILVEAKGAHEGLKAIRVGEEENRTVTGGTLSLRCHGDYKLTIFPTNLYI